MSDPGQPGLWTPGGWAAPPPAPPPGWPPAWGAAGATPLPPQRARRSPLRAVVAGGLIGLLLLGGGVGLGWVAAKAIGARNTDLPVLPGAASGGSLSARAIAAKLDPAIVDIDTVTESVGRTGEAAGTGMIVTASGQVLTNNHVIQSATSIKVTVAGRGTYNARVVGADPTADVALIQLEGAGHLPTVKFAPATSLSVGERVVALGNALGQGGAPAVSEGTVTALHRSITASDGAGGGVEQLTDMVQTNASIISGDSGGALANLSGQVVAMITAGSTQGFAQSSSTVGFAIPATRANSVVSEIRSGQPNSNIVLGQPSFLGVGVQDLDASSAQSLGLNLASGALVIAVTPGSPADRAGITPYSAITSINGQRIGSAAALGPAIHAHHPGTSIAVTWVDQSGTHTANITLTTGPAV